MGKHFSKSPVITNTIFDREPTSHTTTCNIEFWVLFSHTHKALSHTIMGSDSVNAGPAA